MYMIIFQAGVDGVRAGSMSPGVRTVMRLMPVVIFPVMLKFPAVRNLYSSHPVGGKHSSVSLFAKTGAISFFFFFFFFF